MHISIFSTSISTEEYLNVAARILNAIPGIRKWTVDLEDSDRVLRVIAYNVAPKTIEEHLQRAGYICQELPY